MSMKIIAGLTMFGLFGVGLGVFLPGAIMLGKLQARLRTRLAQRKLKAENMIKAEYQSPQQLTAVELGLMYDGEFAQRELDACLLELHQAGVVKVTISDKNTLQYTKTSKSSKLLPYQEQALYLLDETGNRIDWQAHKTSALGMKRALTGGVAGGLIVLSAIATAYHPKMISHTVKQGLIDKGLYKPNGIGKRVAIFAAFLSGILGCLYAPLLAYVVHQPTSQTGMTYRINGQMVDSFPVPWAIGFGVAFGIWIFVFSFPQFLYAIYRYHKALGFGPDATAQLKATWIDIEGYKYYLEIVEKDNLEFELFTEKKVTNKHLPYAIALGVVTLPLAD